ncbi:hypothetical protein QKC54_gp0855 [Megavirus baoshan]|uniref:Mitochondrial fission process protein 1 n=1 Tax=Megavirus baoshan TaxID=2496520 RepID=A0A3Q8U912_9VIRU|nr:hypothetical protein QKC54_gp0855 [Megavirus baoshan]AZL90003.1 hypothetical protein Mb0217 [Megavirus baoshan]
MESDNSSSNYNLPEEVKYVGPLTRALRVIAGFRPASYASDLAEATRGTLCEKKYGIFPNAFIKAMYGVTITYIGADLYFRYLANKHMAQTTETSSDTRCQVLGITPLQRYMGYHTLWHLQASLLFPTVTIHSVVSLTRKLTNKYNWPKSGIRRFMPALFSLAIIPAIIHPLDDLADKIMFHTYCAHTGFQPEPRNH